MQILPYADQQQQQQQQQQQLKRRQQQQNNKQTKTIPKQKPLEDFKFDIRHFSSWPGITRVHACAAVEGFKRQVVQQRGVIRASGVARALGVTI